MLYRPNKIWDGQDAFIIGGGDSLRKNNFDWSLLIPENTIGCNNAFRLGPEICKVCIFCDDKTFIFERYQQGGRKKYKPRLGFYDEIAKFPNPVIHNNDKLKDRPEQWLLYIPRLVSGLSPTPDKLGYNFNTGAAAINLALLYGAVNIYLLGFDMKLGENKRPNWHNHQTQTGSNEVYQRMNEQMPRIKKDLDKYFPDVHVYNINNNSNLTLFPIIDFELFWSERRLKNAG